MAFWDSGADKPPFHTPPSSLANRPPLVNSQAKADWFEMPLKNIAEKCWFLGGFAACSLAAAAPNSSSVVGTAMPALSKKSLR